MNNFQNLYSGMANVYLQGQNALCPIEESIQLSKEIRYCIGDSATSLFITDLRITPVLEASEALRLGYQNGFSKTFNQQAWVEVSYEPSSEKVEIELHDPIMDETGQKELPLLWMGVLEGNIMPAYEVEWEVFKSLPGGTAFVSLIR